MAARVQPPPSAGQPSVLAQGARALNANACSFVSLSSRSSSAEGSPIRCGSPEDERTLDISTEAMAQDDDAQVDPPSSAASDAAAVDEQRPRIPCPRPGLPRQRSSSSSLQRSNSASPPPPPLPHPGLMPAYGWSSGPIPVFHPYYPPGPSSVDMERSASPPMYPVGAPPHFPGGASPPYGSSPPLGASPPLPAGFVRVPIHALAEPGSPTAMHPGHPYGGSPAFGGSPTHMAMAGSPPGGGIMYVPAAAFGPPPPPHHHPHAHPPHHHPGGEFGMAHAHAGFAMHHQQDFVQRMSGMSLAQPGPPMQQAPQQAQQQRHERQQQQGGSDGSPSAGAGYASSGGGGGGGRSGEGRASARIARSHRAGGAYDPTEFEFDLAAAESGREGCRLTLMIRNIPNKYSQAQMLSILQKSSFSGTFDFVYLPIDFRNRCNLGYCFINMLDAGAAARLYRSFHKKAWEEYNSKKVCEVSYARVQGRRKLVQHFRASKFPSDDAEFQPLVYTRITASGAAVDPLPIHLYLEDEAEEEAAAKDGAAAADAACQCAGAGAQGAAPVPAAGEAPAQQA